jgi:hypothetical protein
MPQAGEIQKGIGLSYRMGQYLFSIPLNRGHTLYNKSKTGELRKKRNQRAMLYLPFFDILSMI